MMWRHRKHLPCFGIESFIYCYTHAAIHTKRDGYRILHRAKHHLLWGYPGYQGNSGQNRKAQCQVEMAQKRIKDKRNG